MAHRHAFNARYCKSVADQRPQGELQIPIFWDRTIFIFLVIPCKTSHRCWMDRAESLTKPQ